MSAPAFWSEPAGPAALALSPLGYAYGAITAWRMRRPGARASVPVVCVGNFTVGGAGKTPAVAALAKLLRGMGERPAVLSRGYGGAERGPHLVDPARDDAARVGDEPMLLAAELPVVVGRDRLAAARLAVERAEAGVLLLDDGLQNPRLRKDLTLAVVDGESGAGNGLPFPAGPLRAPVAWQLPAVDALVLVGGGERGEVIAEGARKAGKPILAARLAPAPTIRALAGARVLAFCGIGRPEKFRRTLDEAGVTVERFRAFPDHHAYSAREADRLMGEAAAAGLALVTTRKDHVRLLADPATAGRLAGLVNVVDVELMFDDLGAVQTLLGAALQRRRVSR
jgi:tetraacyldisaccharide 4'-kinase